MITSNPDGALVYLNFKEIGRTPVEVDFTFYGDYDVRLVHPAFEPIVTHEEARSPFWDTIPLDLVAEAVPGEPHAQIHWHYELQPRDDSQEAVLDRAMELRAKLLEDEVPAEEPPQD